MAKTIDLLATVSQRERAMGGKTRVRSEQAHAKIFATALALLDERGYAGISIEAIAQKSGVAKTTIYRWWPTKAAVVLDAYIHTSVRQILVPLKGSLDRMLKTFVRETCRALRTSNAGPAMAALMVEAQNDLSIRELFRDRWIASRREALRSILQRAQKPDQSARSIEVEIAIDSIYGAIWYRLLNEHAPLSEKFATQLAKQALAGLRAVIATGGKPAQGNRLNHGI